MFERKRRKCFVSLQQSKSAVRGHSSEKKMEQGSLERGKGAHV